MPKQVRPEELDHIVAAVGRHPEGVGLEGLFAHPGLDPSRRTLQRRMAQLVVEGRQFAPPTTVRMPALSPPIVAAEPGLSTSVKTAGYFHPGDQAMAPSQPGCLRLTIGKDCHRV